jgi:hypothetical protein
MVKQRWRRERRFYQNSQNGGAKMIEGFGGMAQASFGGSVGVEGGAAELTWART